MVHMELLQPWWVYIHQELITCGCTLKTFVGFFVISLSSQAIAV